jgi:hypothetical protein
MLAGACSREAHSPASAGLQVTPDAGLLASTASQDAGPPAPAQDSNSPRAIPLASAQALLHEVTTPLVLDQVTLVDPGSTFRVEAQVRIDARLLLLDEQDAMVPVQGTTELATVTRFTLAPSEPLRPGSSYTLRLEGATSRETHDADGRAYLPAVLRLRTTGERPAVVTKKPKRGKKRRP